MADTLSGVCWAVLLQREKHVESWLSDFSWLNGLPPGSTAETLTLGQEPGVCNVNETLHTLVRWRRLEVGCALRVQAVSHSRRKQCSTPKDLLQCHVTQSRLTLTAF